MEETKPAWASMGVVGPLVAGIVVALKLAGFDVSGTEGLAESVVALLGAGLGIVGRIRAVKRIDRVL